MSLRTMMSNETTNTSCDTPNAMGMRLTYADTFAFEGRGRSPADCYLRVWRGRGQLPLVLVTGLSDNASNLLSRLTQLVATQVWQRLLPDEREGFIWIERSPERAAPPHRGSDPRYAEHFELVEFTPLGQDVMYLRAEQESRRPVTRLEVEQLIGGTLPMAPDEV